ncbi:hypothetical protein GW17_00003752 [Ensete ventricosum]|nr:hypothetical protein GW17_00003752 [Ensete ventricosum]
MRLCQGPESYKLTHWVRASDAWLHHPRGPDPTPERNGVDCRQSGSLKVAHSVAALLLSGVGRLLVDVGLLGVLCRIRGVSTTRFRPLVQEGPNAVCSCKKRPSLRWWVPGEVISTIKLALWPGTDTARREGKAGVGGEGGMMAYCLFCGASLGGRLPGTKSIDVSGAVPVSLRSFSEERVPFYGENVALFSS